MVNILGEPLKSNGKHPVWRIRIGHTYRSDDEEGEAPEAYHIDRPVKDGIIKHR